MAYVITEKCLAERYGDCVEVCPVDCIHPSTYKGDVFMIIDPKECIDCGACIPACPIDAIVDAVDKDPEYAKINADLTEEFKKNPKIETRPPGDQPRKSTNKRVF